MGLMDRFKTKTVEEIVTTATDTVNNVVTTGMNDKLKKLLYLLPAFAAAVIVFRSDDRKTHSKDIPTKQVIINNYYYSERQGKPNVVDGDKVRN